MFDYKKFSTTFTFDFLYFQLFTKNSVGRNLICLMIQRHPLITFNHRQIDGYIQGIQEVQDPPDS